MHFRIAQAFDPLRLREVAHVLGIHLVSYAQHRNVFWLEFDVLAEALHAVRAELGGIVCCVLLEPGN